ncbi:MAG: GGDEF domain-containing protein [Treponema sp.]|jgi:diguanylate cyclase (GGDEF)-like protein|nr:GGDEF domain-containing protein [Treponema sp.]
MKTPAGVEQDFLSNPDIVKNYSLLQEIGVFKHIDQLNKEIRDYKSLLSGAGDIFQRTTVEEILDAAVRQITDRFLPSFIIFLWKPSQNKNDIDIRVYRNYRQVDQNVGIQSIAPFEPFFKQYPKPIAFEMFAFQARDSVSPEDLEPMNVLDPELLIPILGPSGLYGIVMVGRKMLEKEYLSGELRFLEQLMAFVSLAIQNHLHYEYSVRDVKTGLFNHGFFMTRLNEEIARTQRNNETASLMVMDVDKFKNFNDSYGHLAGDRVLESLAQTIKQTVRIGDIPSRFGGEEFTILLPNTSRQTAWIAAERLRNAVANMKVSWEPPLPQVTISIGVVSFDKSIRTGAEEVIHRADEALYQSKENGRNRTSVWGTGLLFRIQRGPKPA